LYVDPLILVLATAAAVMTAAAALLAAGLRGRGPLARSQVLPPDARPDRRRTDRPGFLLSDHPVRRTSRDRGAPTGPPAEGVDELIRGSLATVSYDRAVRVLAWTFIMAVLLIVALSGLWPQTEPQIVATMVLGGMFVLLVHELLPAGSIGALRIVAEASVAIVFLTMLVVLTGHTASPFFFLFAPLVGGASLVAAPGVALALAVETAVAYGVIALSGPLDPDTLPAASVLVAINVTALVLAAYAGMVIARVQRRTREAAIHLSTVDSLTDLANRAFLFGAVEREIERSRRYRRGFCLLMMDLDELKAINDRFGHHEGDLVLRGVAQAIRSSLRTIDVAARYGGDEFVALLPETDPSGAYVVAEKIRQVVSGLSVESNGSRIATSLSIGVVAYPEDGQTPDELMIAADEAMYLSKRLGKNRVVGYMEPGEAPPVPGARTLDGAGLPTPPNDGWPGEHP
jgi:diguanylate cyclase (GGDEF)-like protein